MRRAILLAVVMVMVCLAAPAAEAGGWRMRQRGYDPYQQPVALPPFASPRTDAYWRAQYPQYYGGFHARHLQNIGIPTGDIGIRGNSITVNPW